MEQEITTKKIMTSLRQRKNVVFKHFNKFPQDVKRYLSKSKYRKFIMSESPMRPIKDTESFLFKPGTKSLSVTDGWSWGESETRKNKVGVEQTRFYVKANGKKTKEWCRIVYYLPDIPSKERVYLVVYQGDDKFASKLPFHSATNKKVIEEIKNSDGKEPLKVYKDMIIQSNSDLKNYKDELKDKYKQTNTVKNLQQVYNVQHNQRVQKEIGPDKILNILEINSNIDEFIHEFKLIPELQIIFGSKEALKYCQCLLDFSRRNPDAEQCLSYDTSFNLGDFFLSVLTMRNIFMKEKCTFPMLFHITETKREKRHNEFFFWLNNNFNIKNIDKLPICSDREIGIYKSILFNELNLCLCTLHLIRDVKLWSDKKIKKNLLKKDEANNLIRYIEAMIDCDTKDKFNKVNDKFFQKFENNKLIIDYYVKYLKKDIEFYCAKFYTKKFAAFKKDRPTTNQSESMNKVIKQVTDHKEVPIDKILLILHNFQNYYINEFHRALNGLGQYKISDIHPKNLSIQVDNFSTLDSLLASINSRKTQEKAHPKTFEVKNSDRSVALEIAHQLIERDSLKWLGNYFTCESYNKQNVYKLTLIPKPSCTCGMKTTCSHLLALMIKMNLYKEDDKSKINLMNIVKSKFKKKSKSGQKHFRKIDKEKRKNEFLDNVLNEEESNHESESSDDHISINLDDITSNLGSFSPLSKSEIVHVPNFLIKDRNKFYDELLEKSKTIIMNPNLFIFSKLRKRKIKQLHVTPWVETKIDQTPFVGELECLKAGQWLFSNIIDQSIKALISEMFYEDIVSYLGISSIDNILFNNTHMLYHYSFAQTLLNKNIIFFNIISNNVAYIPRDHFYLGIICMHNKSIIILDSLSNGKKLENYTLTFMGLLNVVKLIYSTSTFMNFIEDDWKLIVSSDAAQQNDDINCGLFVIANVACILKRFQLNEIENIVQARFWVRNLIERNKDMPEYGAVVPKELPEFSPIIFKNYLEIDIKDTSDIMGNLMTEASTNFYSPQCSFPNCIGSRERRYICCNCRSFFHNSHDFFAKNNDAYFKICNNCYQAKFFDAASAPILD